MPPACVTHTASQTQHATHGRALPDDRSRVGREREHPVQRALRVARAHTAGQRREHPCRLRLAQIEVLRGERHQRGLHRATRRAELRLRRHDRLVPVVADAEMVLALTEVQRHVLMTHDRLLEPVEALQPRDRVGPDQLVLDGDERDRHPGHRADRRTPDAGAQEHALALDTPLRGLDRVDPATGRIEPRDGHAPGEGNARASARARERLDDLHALARAVARDPVAAEHRRGVKQGERSAHSAGDSSSVPSMP